MRSTEESRAQFFAWLRNALASGRPFDDELAGEIQTRLARMGLGDRAAAVEFRAELLRIALECGYIFTG